jgi:hypothetical protein
LPRRFVALRIIIFRQRRYELRIIWHGHYGRRGAIRYSSSDAVDHGVIGPKRSVRHDAAIRERDVSTRAVRDGDWWRSKPAEEKKACCYHFALHDARFYTGP